MKLAQLGASKVGDLRDRLRSAGVSVPEQDVEPISWTVREFVLVRSLVGRGRYIRLAKWPLRG